MTEVIWQQHTGIDNNFPKLISATRGQSVGGVQTDQDLIVIHSYTGRITRDSIFFGRITFGFLLTVM